MLLRFINGRNNNRKFLSDMFGYIIDQSKTENGKYIASNGCSHTHILEDMLANKKLHNKTAGKQGEHFVISFYPDRPEVSNAEILNISAEIAETVYPEYLSVTTLYLDTKVRHTHTLLDSVNAVTGKKFSQSPSALNRVRQKINGILQKHGFEIITASANDFVDCTDYPDVEGFDFLELDESELITESDIDEISNYTDSVSINNTFNSWNHSDCCSENYFGDYNTMNNYKNYTPCVPQTQELPAPTTTIETVPTTVETPKNSYPNTNVVTGPTFRIKGTPSANLAGLDELIAQTTSYAHEHQREASNLALAMQQYGQKNGYPCNVSVIAGPIFDIDLTGTVTYDNSGDYDDDEDMWDYGANK